MVTAAPVKYSLSPEVMKQLADAVLAANAATKPATTAIVPVAEQSAALDGLARFNLMGIPVGEALVGGMGGFFLGRALQKIVPPIGGSLSVPLIELLAAFIAIKWGRKVLGTTGASAAALFLAFDAARQVLPVDSLINQAVAFIPSVGGLGLGGGSAAKMMQDYSAGQGGGSAVVNRLSVTNI